jgi:exopolysaccharide biosynthesis polyprenyl glycosylphosphotransferase
MSLRFGRRRVRMGYLLAFGDALLVLASLALSYGLLTATGVRSLESGELALKLSLGGSAFVGIQISVLYVFGLYALRKRRLDWRQVGPLLLAVGTGAVLTSGVLFFLPRFLIGRQILLVHAPLLCAALFAWRYAFYRLVVADEPPRKLAIAGRRKTVLEFIADLRAEELCEYAVSKAYVSPPTETSEVELHPELSHIEWCQDLDKLLGTRDYHALALDTRELGHDARVAQRVIELSFAGIPIFDLTTLHKDLTGRYSASAVEGSSIVEAIATRVGPNRYYWRAKRLADVLLGGAALAVSAVPMLVIAALIKLESRGPTLFVQERLGRGRHPFRCIKFRTMVTDAERHSGPVWAAEDDPRITRLGSLLRKTRLDELPQLINVVKGEMTLVGPRPIRAHFADQLAKEIPFYDLRFAMKPGLTGWAQAHQHYVRSIEEQEVKFRYELFYLENYSLWLDLYTLVKTLRVVVARQGG